MKRILIVDEMPEIITEVYDLLSPIYDISVSNSSLEALVLIRNNRYDLIVMDISLQDMNGFDLLTETRKLQDYKDVPIIISSQILMDEEINKGYFLGANEFMTKPLHKQVLLRRIKDQIELHEKEELPKTEIMETRHMVEDMYRMMENLCEVIENKDYTSSLHIMRLGHYYRLLVNEIKKKKHMFSRLRDINIDDLVMAAKMHDIGKITTPNSILSKPGSLTKYEYETMQNHAYNGYHILNRMSERVANKDMIKYSEEIALSHHEKWNGKGYPRQLKETEIPLIARIMSLVDVYDALTSDRIYKKALNHEQAIEVIRKERGQSFDPEIVDIFIESHEKFLNAYNTYKDMEAQDELSTEINTPSCDEILIVEADPISREIMGSQLRQRGFGVSYSAAGMDAIMMLKNGDRGISCILVDYKMSDFDNYNFIRLVRKVNPNVVAFCVTDENYSQVAKQVKDEGYDGCFIKPLDCELLQYQYNRLKQEREVTAV